jgi:hypothetical protein
LLEERKMLVQIGVHQWHEDKRMTGWGDVGLNTVLKRVGMWIKIKYTYL